VALDALDEAACCLAVAGETELDHRRPAGGAVQGLERLGLDLHVGRALALAVDDAGYDAGAAKPLVGLALRLTRVEGELQVHRWW
jgi:hypothetical protein